MTEAHGIALSLFHRRRRRRRRSNLFFSQPLSFQKKRKKTKNKKPQQQEKRRARKQESEQLRRRRRRGQEAQPVPLAVALPLSDRPLGVASGGAEALRLDSVRVPASTSLETYLGSGWIDGLQAKSIEAIGVNGLPAATATAKGGEWTFRVAVVRLGTDVYRLIFATRNLTDAIDRRFRASIDTFRRLGSDESAEVKPLHIAVVKAGAGDTTETLAARMALTDRQLETFLLLNGLEKGAAVEPGKRYKLVVE